LVIAASLLLLLVVVAGTTLGSSARFGLDTLPHFRSRLGMLGMALCGPGAFVRQAGKLRDILDVMRGELFQHLLIVHTLAKCDYNTSIGNTRNGVVNLRELLDEGARMRCRRLLLPSLMMRGVDGRDDELIDIVTPLLCD
jgi:hypothetical protein